jgi:uncharacterized protein DUF4360
MTGFAEIPKKGKGYCDNTFSFTGQRDKIVYPLTLKGPYSGNFDLQTSPGISSWSPCGGSTAILNMNTQCNLSPTNLEASIAVSLVTLNAWLDSISQIIRSTPSAEPSPFSSPSSGSAAASRLPALIVLQ